MSMPREVMYCGGMTRDIFSLDEIDSNLGLTHRAECISHSIYGPRYQTILSCHNP